MEKVIQNYLREFLNGNLSFEELTTRSKNFDFYIRQKEELNQTQQLNYQEIFEKIKNSPLKSHFISSMKDINENILYKSELHGINHNIKVCILAFIICSFEDIDEHTFDLALTACKYHDIGRVNDLVDNEHGIRGANRLSFLGNKYDAEDLNILKTIITCHSLHDSKYPEIAEKNMIKSKKVCDLVFKILKDADGLDRVRLNDFPYVGVNFLRLDTSKHLILFSYQLNENYMHYKVNQNEVLKTPTFKNL